MDLIRYPITNAFSLLALFLNFVWQIAHNGNFLIIFSSKMTTRDHKSFRDPALSFSRRSDNREREKKGKQKLTEVTDGHSFQWGNRNYDVTAGRINVWSGELTREKAFQVLCLTCVDSSSLERNMAKDCKECVQLFSVLFLFLQFFSPISGKQGKSPLNTFPTC